MKSGGASCTAVTDVVFCAVRATTALMPWHPRRANAFRSAWMPAPPPESEVAIVRQRGITMSPGVEATIGLRGDCDRLLGRASRRRGDRVPRRDRAAQGCAGASAGEPAPARAGRALGEGDR